MARSRALKYKTEIWHIKVKHFGGLSLHGNSANLPTAGRSAAICQCVVVVAALGRRSSVHRRFFFVVMLALVSFFVRA